MTDIEEKYNAALNFVNSGYGQKGFGILCSISDADDANVQNLLGECYYFGNGTILNRTAAVKYFTKAAEKGVAQSQYYLGLCYYLADGVPQDYQLAVSWFTKAARQGNDKAMYYLGECFRYGLGVEASESISLKWYTDAAELGNVAAQDMLDPQKAKKHDKDQVKTKKHSGSDDSKSNDIPFFIKLLGCVGLPYYINKEYILGGLCSFSFICLILFLAFLISMIVSSGVCVASVIFTVIFGLIGCVNLFLWGRLFFIKE